MINSWSPLEEPYYQKLFRLVDNEGRGELSAKQASELFRKSGLPEPVLHAIWDIADQERLGVLNPASFHVACRLVAHAQRGTPPSRELVTCEPIYLPFFDLQTLPHPKIIRPVASPSLAPPAKKYYTNAKYEEWFHQLDTDQDGFVTGQNSKEFFKQSQLPEEELFQIWNMADEDQDGLLSLSEFINACSIIVQRNLRLNNTETWPPSGNMVSHLTKPATVAFKQKDDDIFSSKSDDNGEKARCKDRITEKTNIFKSNRLDERTHSSSVENQLVERTGDSLKRKIQESIDFDYKDIRALLLEVENENAKKAADLIDIDNMLSKKRDFETELEKLRFQFDLVKEERRNLDLERVRTTVDCQARADLILLYKSEIESTREDIERLSQANQVNPTNSISTTSQWLASAVSSNRQQIDAIDGQRKKAMDDIRDEKSSLQKILLEIRNLKEASEKLRRQKENLVAENLVAEHKFKESDQERYLMVAGMEAERSRLQALRDERMKVVDQKEKLVGCIDDVRLVKKLFLQTVWGGTTVLRKDNKGVPAGGSQGVPAGGSQGGESLHYIPGHQRQWETFDGSRTVSRPFNFGSEPREY